MKKGFTLVELLAVIVILAIIALIVTPVVNNIIKSARNAANARSVEGHIRNVELVIMTKAFNEETGDLTAFDLNGEDIPDSVKTSLPNNDDVTCETYKVENGTVVSATGCSSERVNWNNNYMYTNKKGAFIFEFNGTVIKPGLVNGNPTQDVISSTITLPMADSTGKSIVTHKGIVYIDPANPERVCNASSTITTTATGCKKFYIYKDDGTSYKMINDRNIIAKVAWINEEDFLAHGGTQADWNANKYTTLGRGYTAEKALMDATTDWSNTGIVDLISANEVAEIVGIDEAVLYDASLPYVKYPSTANIGTVSSWFYLDGGRNGNPSVYSESSNGWQKKYATTAGSSNYGWLYNYLNQCGSGCGSNISVTDGSRFGYWTKTPLNDSYKTEVFVVTSYGSLNFSANTWYYEATGRTNIGIRPVITVEKALID